LKVEGSTRKIQVSTALQFKLADVMLNLVVGLPQSRFQLEVAFRLGF
jgi:hypothetical protein